MARVEVGDLAPDFTATTHDGETFRSRDLLGRQALVVFFYPRDGTPVCTREVCEFRDAYQQFLARDARVIGVSRDRLDRHHDFAHTHKLPYPLISDTDGELHKAFGLKRVFGFLPPRVTFVIDKQGIVRMRYAALLASDEHVRRALAALDAASAP